MAARGLKGLHAALVGCRACPRLVQWREEVARVKVRRFRAETYWGKPVPGFGDPEARLLILGLAPAAHGANRTGRMFTGDRSGDFLFAGLHRAGFAKLPTSTHAGDGQALAGAFITAPCRCAPPANKPTPGELAACASWLDRELDLLPEVRVVLALGRIGWDAALAAWTRRGTPAPGGGEGRASRGRRPPFGHGAETRLGEDLVLLGSYHVSQQNTQTGRLSPSMFDEVLARARALAATRRRFPEGEPGA